MKRVTLLLSLALVLGLSVAIVRHIAEAAPTGPVYQNGVNLGDLLLGSLILTPKLRIPHTFVKAAFVIARV